MQVVRSALAIRPSFRFATMFGAPAVQGPKPCVNVYCKLKKNVPGRRSTFRCAARPGASHRHQTRRIRPRTRRWRRGSGTESQSQSRARPWSAPRCLPSRRRGTGDVGSSGCPRPSPTAAPPSLAAPPGMAGFARTRAHCELSSGGAHRRGACRSCWR